MASQGQLVEFSADVRAGRGYSVRGGGAGKMPGLIVIQEFWGLNDHIKDMAGRFAEAGYEVLAPDLYDGVLAKNSNDASRLMGELDQSRALAILEGSVDYLAARPTVNPDAIGVTGFCMGGSFALLLACRDSRIKAAAPFYGDPPPEDTLKNLSCPIFFVGAEKDQWITAEKMNRLRDSLKRHGKQGEVKIYTGAGHAFMNDTRPEAFNEEAAADAWDRVIKFLDRHLNG